MPALRDILVQVQPLQIAGDAGMEARDISIDSRQVRPGTAFIALRGTTVDGHQFIDKAITAGASVIVCETMPAVLQERVCYVQVKDSMQAAGQMADSFFGSP